MPPRRRKPPVVEGEVVKGPWKARSGDGAVDVKVPTSKPRGNTASDQAWLEAQMEAGLIEPVEADEGQEIPFGAMLRWTGKDLDVGAYWQLPPEGRRCNARSKVRDAEGRYIIDGATGRPLEKPCARWPIRGARVCVPHGGGQEAVKRAAQFRLLGAADELVGQLINIALDTSVEPSDRVRAINSALDRIGIRGGQEIQVNVPKWQQMLQDVWQEDQDAG